MKGRTVCVYRLRYREKRRRLEIYMRFVCIVISPGPSELILGL